MAIELTANNRLIAQFCCLRLKTISKTVPCCAVATDSKDMDMDWRYIIESQWKSWANACKNHWKHYYDWYFLIKFVWCLHCKCTRREHFVHSNESKLWLYLEQNWPQYRHILHPKLETKRIQGRYNIFYGTLIFRQSSMICIVRHLGGQNLRSQRGNS